jgi:LCP family protein required for cell wall assembly
VGKHVKGRGSKGAPTPKRQPAASRDQAASQPVSNDGAAAPQPRPSVLRANGTAAAGRARNPDPAARYRDESRAKRRRTKTIVFGVLGVVALLCLAGVGYAWQLAHSVEQDINSQVISDPQIAKALTKKPLIPPKKQDPFTVLLLGVDHLGVKGDTRSDTIILGRVDPGNKKVWLMSIPRDTRADIPGYGVRKINAAYQLGGPALTIKTVSMLTGVQPDHYLEVDIAGFKRIVDVMGGVWINVRERINDPKAAGANAGRKGAVIEKGYQKLDPNQAIVYVRSRAYADADFGRMRHQQDFLKAVAKQASQPSMLPRLPRLIRTVARYLSTDLKLGELITVVRDVRGIQPADFQTTTVPGEWRSPYVWPDEAKMKALVAKMQAGREFKASTNPKDVVPANYTVVVRNGSGISGLAATAAGLLRPAGWKIGEVGNAKRQDYPSTMIIYDPENIGVAKRILSTIKKGKLVPDTTGKYTFDGDVLVVVGRDWRTSSTTPTASTRP